MTMITVMKCCESCSYDGDDISNYDDDDRDEDDREQQEVLSRGHETNLRP